MNEIRQSSKMNLSIIASLLGVVLAAAIGIFFYQPGISDKVFRPNIATEKLTPLFIKMSEFVVESTESTKTKELIE